VSISSARHFLEKSGCGWVVGGLLALVMLASLATGQCGMNQQGPNAQNQTKTEVAKIGSQSVTLEDISSAVQSILNQGMMPAGGLSPDLQAQLYAGALMSSVDAAVSRELAAAKGVALSPEQMTQAIEQQIDTELDATILQFKQQLIQQGKLKATASEAEFNEVFKKESGRELSQARADVKKQRLDEINANPAQRQQYEQRVYGQKLQDAMTATTTLTDEQLKEEFNTFTTKRIIKYVQTAQGDPMAQLQKIRQDIVDKKITFEEAMNRYSDDPAQTGKSKSDSTVNLKISDLNYDPRMEVLKNLKVGEMSEVINTAAGPAIFRIEKIAPALPADFEQKKDEYKKSSIQLIVGRKMFDERQAFVKGDKITWKSAACKALFDWQMAGVDPELNGDKTKLAARYREIYESIGKGEQEPADPALVGFAKYGIFNAWYNSLSPAEQKEKRAEKLEAMQEVIQIDGNIDTRLELATMATDDRNAELAFEQIKNAAASNGGDDASALDRYKKIDDLKRRLVVLKLLQPAQVEELDAEQKRFRTDVFEKLKLEADIQDYSEAGRSEWTELKKKIDDLTKQGILTSAQAQEIKALEANWKAGKVKFDAEQKKIEEDLKKEEEAAKKAGGATGQSAPGSTTGGAAPSSGSLTTAGGGGN
jgi:hypothetical protein